jgi:hypothetical protein
VLVVSNVATPALQNRTKWGWPGIPVADRETGGVPVLGTVIVPVAVHAAIGPPSQVRSPVGALR